MDEVNTQCKLLQGCGPKEDFGVVISEDGERVLYVLADAKVHPAYITLDDVTISQTKTPATNRVVSQPFQDGARYQCIACPGFAPKVASGPKVTILGLKSVQRR